MTLRSCIHFAPPLSCRAGVEIEAVRDSDLRLPCKEVRVISLTKVTGNHAISECVTGTIPCEKRQWPAEAPLPSKGVMEAMLEAASAGLCPTCKEPMRGEAVVGDKVYAMPCRHILRGKEDPHG